MARSRNKKPRQIIRSFEARALKKRTSAIKFADKLTGFFGSFGFLIINILTFICWITINSGVVPGISAFDEYPFVLLINLVSLEAIILTSVVLISQNRQNQIDTLRDELQLQVELISEKEITKTLRLVLKLLEHHKIKIKDKELEEMLEQVDTSYIEKKLEDQISKKG
ncbi:DUF1003 domain-containing protein [Candidatus Woesebacteria bacterium]|nr:DUF1003 domain-containing protein [Candidatus Woesebacteria bacterium]